MSDLTTPAGAEAKLRELVSSITQAQVDLKEARNRETAAEVALKKARITAFHAGDCPKVTRGGYTVADRDAWIDRQTLEQWEAHRWATTAKESAQDYQKALVSVLEAVRSINALHKAAFSMAGHS